jgi:hypothetical protein
LEIIGAITFNSPLKKNIKIFYLKDYEKVFFLPIAVNKIATK